MAARVGDLVNEQLGWEVDLKHYDVCVSVCWSDASVVVELPLTNVQQSRSCLAHHALRGPVGWAMATLAQLQPALQVVDPMVGRAGTLLEASLVEPTAHLIGFDIDDDQLAAAIDNVAGSAIEICQGCAMRLPLANNSCDRIICDLPFGKKHGTAASNRVLYPRAITEMKRVLKPDGLAVLLTTCKSLVEQCVRHDSEWLPTQCRQLYLGGIQGYILVLQRSETPQMSHDRLSKEDQWLACNDVRRRRQLRYSCIMVSQAVFQTDVAWLEQHIGHLESKLLECSDGDRSNEQWVVCQLRRWQSRLTSVLELNRILKSNAVEYWSGNASV